MNVVSVLSNINLFKQNNILFRQTVYNFNVYAENQFNRKAETEDKKNYFISQFNQNDFEIVTVFNYTTFV